MALTWWRTAIRSDSELFSDAWSVVQIPIGATLKRVIVSCYIESGEALDADSIRFLTHTPIVNTLEVTAGSPPPFPENPGRTLPGNRDFLHYDVTTMKTVLEGGTTTVLTTAFNDGSVSRWDTSVQRKNLTDPMEVFWSWGFLYGGTFPARGAFSRMVASSLLDVGSPIGGMQLYEGPSRLDPSAQ